MRVLLIDSSFAAYGIYQSLCEMGIEVFTIGNREDDYLAIINQDNHILKDYSCLDVVEKECKDKKIYNLIPGCTDASLSTYLMICNKNINSKIKNLGKMCLDKGLLYKACRESFISVPRKYELGSHFKKLIVKPTDGYSGNGITVVDVGNGDSLRAAIETAKQHSHNSQYTVEEFVEGDLFSISTVIQKDKYSILSIVREICNVNKFRVDTSYLVEPETINFMPSIEKNLKNLCEKFGSDQPLFLHIQFIVEDNQIYIIEIMMRHPGDLYSQLIEMSLNLKYSEIYAKTFLGLNNCKHINNRLPKLNKPNPVLRKTIHKSKQTHQIQINTTESKSIISIPLKRIGDNNTNQSRCAVVFLSFENWNNLYSNLIKEKNEFLR